MNMETIKKALLYIIKKQKEGVETTVTFDAPLNEVLNIIKELSIENENNYQVMQKNDSVLLETNYGLITIKENNNLSKSNE